MSSEAKYELGKENSFVWNPSWKTTPGLSSLLIGRIMYYKKSMGGSLLRYLPHQGELSTENSFCCWVFPLIMQEVVNAGSLGKASFSLFFLLALGVFVGKCPTLA